MRSFPDSCGHSNTAREEQESVGLGPRTVLGAKVKLWVLYSPVGSRHCAGNLSRLWVFHSVVELTTSHDLSGYGLV